MEKVMSVPGVGKKIKAKLVQKQGVFQITKSKHPLNSLILLFK